MLSVIFLLCIASFATAYLFYGRFLIKRFDLSDARETPAHTLRDNVDYCPARVPVLLGHHFSSIAGAGPIVGPVIAGLAFGWLPALIWIVLGSIFIGGVHDYGSLVASIRHKAKSIAEIARTCMSQRANRLFLIFIWLALVLVLAAFIDLTAKTFVQDGGVALSSAIFIVLALVFGISVHRAGLRLSVGTVIFVALVFAGIYAGYRYPFDSAHLETITGMEAGQAYTWILVAYCFIASIAPVWLLLQARDYLSSFLLYGCLLGGCLGIVLFSGSVNFPPFLAFRSQECGLLVPFLFIYIACGACSGFHSVVSSGTTAKQLNRERDALPIGYGAMLLEGTLAVIALSAVMICARGDETLGRHPTAVFASGLGTFLGTLGVPEDFGFKFGLLAISTFLLTTLDTGTRLARYVFEEFVGRRDMAVKLVANACTLGLPLILLSLKVKAGGEEVPAYKLIWPMFGATNQLLGGLALLTVAVWLKKSGRKALFVFLPMTFMIGITMIALVELIRGAVTTGGGLAETANGIKAGYSALLLLLAVFLVLEAVRSLRSTKEAVDGK